jgi:3-oxoacyl-[acyl-carrier protein] reductase
MNKSEQSLKGKTAVVTGAGRGIGRAIAIMFAKAGADIAICARSAEELEKVRETIESTGVSCVVGIADLTDREATENFCAKTIEAFGKIDILVNNAGGLLEKSKVADSDIDKWWRTIEINVKGPYMVTRLLLDSLVDGAKIINLSTGVALRAGIQNSAYHVAKAGLHMFTEALANELQARCIDVNNLIPGPTATSAFDNKPSGERSTSEELLTKFADKPPPGLPDVERLKHPDEVAELALLMATMPVCGPNGQTFSLARRPL